MKTDTLSFNEFLCVTLLYAATVNEEFTANEKAAIVKEVGIETYENMYARFDKMSDFEALETIANHKGIHYPTLERRQEVLDKIKAIFHADNEYDILEKEIFNLIQKII